jgi:hypothetical protein
MIKNIIQKLFCSHYWVKPKFQKIRHVYPICIQYEFRCEKCNKLKWSNYENIEPEPNFIV